MSGLGPSERSWEVSESVYAGSLDSTVKDRKGCALGYHHPSGRARQSMHVVRLPSPSGSLLEKHVRVRSPFGSRREASCDSYDMHEDGFDGL